MAPATVSRAQVLAFRLGGHHLDHRLTRSRLVEAAAACGLINAPPTTAAVSLWNRVAGLTRADVEAALVEHRTLLQTWSLRGSPHVFPTTDAAVFTRALAPPDEGSLRALLGGAGALLERVELSASALVDLVATATLEVLDGQVIVGKTALDAAIAAEVRPQLSLAGLSAWDAPSPFAPGQTLGQALVSFALRPVALRGVVCFAARVGNQAAFARTDQWLGHAPAPNSPPRSDSLVRRYLRCYAPATLAEFAAWAGIGRTHAEMLWAAERDRLVEVRYAGGTRSVHADDLGALERAGSPSTVRLLPPLDPWVQVRDRATILADRSLHPQVWRSTGWPGTVIVDGLVLGRWRGHVRRAVLDVSVQPFGPLDDAAREGLDVEARSLARFKGLADARVAAE